MAIVEPWTAALDFINPPECSIAYNFISFPGMSEEPCFTFDPTRIMLEAEL